MSWSANQHQEMEKQCSIVIATGTYPPEVSGQATFTGRLVESLQPAGWQLKAVTYGAAERSGQSIGVTRIERNQLRHLNYYLALRRTKAEIIYAQDLFSSGLPAALAKRRHQKLVLRLGGDFLWEKMVNSGRTEVSLADYYQQPKTLSEKIYLALYRFILKRCDIVIFNTEWQEQLYRKVFTNALSRTVVIPNPITPPTVKPAPGNELIFAGRFVPLKNLPRLLAAFRNVETDKHLVLIGNGPQRSMLENLASADPRVSIIGPFSRAQVLERIAAGYGLVLPSLSELSPNTALEALSFGKPVLVTKETGLPSQITNACLLVDPISQSDIEEKLRQLVDPLKRQELERLANTISGLPSWNEVVARHQKLFSELCTS